ncbi:hypothetical protein PO124_02840 [Bacillus licheniformis]|nr:hypothetical protein [Bacillus licheniformis]
MNVLATKCLSLKRRKGNFRVKASPKWTQGANGNTIPRWLSLFTTS